VGKDQAPRYFQWVEGIINDEARMSNDETGMTKAAAPFFRRLHRKQPGAMERNDFGFCHSFVIRHSSFVIRQLRVIH